MNRKEYVKETIPQIVQTLRELVEIPSVMDMETASEQAPFGQDIARALEHFLYLARQMGMQTRNYEGYTGEITLGEGETMIGILGHIDVVSAGEGWKTPPFDLTEKDGNLYGRGSSDDKGPLVSSLYAMRYMKENHLIPEGFCVRMIVGADEEEDLRCIDYYIRHAERLPDMYFVPDGYFPLVNCEKGLIDFDLKYTDQANEDAEAEIISISGGTGRNIVPGSACCVLRTPLEQRASVGNRLHAMPDLLVIETENGFRLETTGQSTHAMAPENGKNAISMLLCAMKQSGVRFSHQAFIDGYAAAIGMGYHGEGLHCDFSDELSGALTLNVGMLEMRENTFLIKANARYPVSKTYEEIHERFAAEFEKSGFVYTEALVMPYLYVSEDAPLIQKLMTAYREVTGDTKNQPFSIGGATYARSLSNAVSFGPLFPGEVELAHEANECIAVESLRRMTEIYIAALEQLLQ